MSIYTLIQSRDNYQKIRSEILSLFKSKDFDTMSSLFPDFCEALNSLCRIIGLGNYPPLLHTLANQCFIKRYPLFTNTSIPIVYSEQVEELLSTVNEYIKMHSDPLPHPQKSREFQVFHSQKDLENAFNASNVTLRNHAKRVCGAIDTYHEYFTKHSGEYKIPTELFDKIYFKLHPSV